MSPCALQGEASLPYKKQARKSLVHAQAPANCVGTGAPSIDQELAKEKVCKHKIKGPRLLVEHHNSQITKKIDQAFKLTF